MFCEGANRILVRDLNPEYLLRVDVYPVLDLKHNIFLELKEMPGDLVLSDIFIVILKN